MGIDLRMLWLESARENFDSFGKDDILGCGTDLIYEVILFY